MAKRIMRKFRLTEVSCVDRPAQEGAKVLIMKRDSRGQIIMDGIMGETMNADQAILESVQSILEDADLDTEPRVALLLESLRQYIVATGASLDNPRFGGPDSLGATIIATTKAAVAELRKADPSLSEIKARARLFENPDNADLVKRYNEAIAALEDQAVLEKASRVKQRPETPEQRANRRKQQRAQRTGAPSKTSPVRKALEPVGDKTFNSDAAHALRKRADEFMKADPNLTFGRALDRIASSREPYDREIWAAARAE
jgi:hypothetical protein